MPSSLIFLDTETTGLALTDDIWEFAGIRRASDGSESRLHLFIEHDWKKCDRLPESFRADHMSRFPSHDEAVDRAAAAHKIYYFMSLDAGGGKPHIVGAVPNFDTERLFALLARYGYGWQVHHHLIDVENLAIGYLAGVGQQAVNDGAIDGIDLDLLAPPWDSNELSRAVGIDPDKFCRHTAMGDAEWAMAIYDRVVGGV